MVERLILHVDMDAFYAAIEQRDHPEYRGKPVIVGGPVEQRSVVSTASYEARAYGVHSAMSMAEARRRCPDGIYVPVHMSLYRAVSKELMEIFHQYTPDVEALSLDEAFLDVTGCQRMFGTGEEIARKIKQDVTEKLRLTASVGVSYNKFLAKLASDLDKPDGLCVILPQDLETKVWPLPVQKMMGVGEKTQATLAKMNIRTIGQLAKTDRGLMERILGKQGAQMVEVAKGLDLRPVESYREQKSIGREMTFPKDLTDRDQLENILFDLTDYVCYALRQQGIKGKTVSVKIKYADFTLVTRANTMSEYSGNFEPIFAQVKQLLYQHYETDRPVRLIGMSVSNLKKNADIVEQQDLFAEGEQTEKYDALNQVMDAMNQRFGKRSIIRGPQLQSNQSWNKE